MRHVCLAVLATLLSLPVCAEEVRPDDTVAYDLSAEDWVTTKTAHVTLNVEAAVNGGNAGAMRSDMTKAVNDAAKGDWRLTGFNRSQDQTGLEHWSVSFDSRLPESALNGLPETLKKASKPGMQIAVGDIDFSPTLEETEAMRASLRAKIMKQAADQLSAINTTLPGRTYRLSQISFEQGNVAPAPRMLRKPIMMSAMANASSASGSEGDMQDHVQKMVLTAHVVYGALPPVPTK